MARQKRKRIVDYNQGLDARYLDESKMRILAEIPLEPMRLAFDSIKLKHVYLKAVRLAHKYGQKEMSNYILYNFDDVTQVSVSCNVRDLRYCEEPGSLMVLTLTESDPTMCTRRIR